MSPYWGELFMKIKFFNIVKIGAILAVGSFFALNVKSCVDGEIKFDEGGRKTFDDNNNPTTSQSDFVNQPTTLDYHDSYFADDYEEYVNDNIYHILLSAKAKYEDLLNYGDSVSQKMINNGVSLNENISGFVDHGMKGIYQLICDYVSAYEINDYATCYVSAKQLSDFTNTISKSFMYSLLVNDGLDNEFQSPIKCDQFGNFVFENGNIVLENGRQIKVIGGLDSILSESNLSDVDSRIKWIEEIPLVIFTKYSQIKNNNNDGVCYIINETKAEDCYLEEYDNLLTSGSLQYSFDKTDAEIKCINDDYVFVKDNSIYGLLDYNQKSEFVRIQAVKNALISHQADALYLDSCVTDLYNNHVNRGYNK